MASSPFPVRDSSLPKVALVILNWNGREDVLRCVATLARLSYGNWTATVVDNASADGSVEALRQRFPQQRVLLMERNLGFCGGNNRGIADALAQGAQYVLLLNNDTEVHPDLVGELVRAAGADARIGVVGAKNLRLESPHEVWGAWNELTYDAQLVRVAGQGRADGPEYGGLRDVDGVIGNGMMLSRAAVERVGGFDESFFGYHEDIDWCTRARGAGFRVVYCGSAIVYHRGFGAADPRRPVPFPVLYFLGRNGIHFARKHAPRPLQVRFAALFLLSVAARIAAAPARGERIKPYLWMLRGFADGLRGRLPLRDLKLQ
jgi:hypothetical protein